MASLVDGQVFGRVNQFWSPDAPVSREHSSRFRAFLTEVDTGSAQKTRQNKALERFDRFRSVTNRSNPARHAEHGVGVVSARAMEGAAQGQGQSTKFLTLPCAMTLHQITEYEALQEGSSVA